jgi:Plasmid encoded RepA protein
MNAWLTKMAITSGGRTRELVAEQPRRISACRLTFFTERGPAEYRQNGAFVRDAISLSGLMDAAQPSIWQDRVRLDEGFWASLRAIPCRPVKKPSLLSAPAVWQSTSTSGLPTDCTL